MRHTFHYLSIVKFIFGLKNKYILHDHYGKINLEKMMNKLIYFFLFLLVSLTVKAQFTSEGADLISRFRPGVMWFNTGLRPAEIEKVRKYDRLVFDITYSDWAGESKPFQNKWASLGLNSSIY
jgi:hypothetical protein